MAERPPARSALQGFLGRHRASAPCVRITEAPMGALWQVTAWPDALTGAGSAVAATAALEEAPGPGGSADGGTGWWALRTEPLRWLLFSATPQDAPGIEPADGTILDLGHARTRLVVEGEATLPLMERLVALDLRPGQSGGRTVFQTPIHHVGCTLWLREGRVELLVPRSFALGLAEHIAEIAEPFGLATA